MNATEPNEPPPSAAPPPAPSYSAFGAVFLVFLALIVLQGLYLADDFRQRARLQAAEADLAGAVAQAQGIQLTAERVGHELLALAAAKSAEAARIVADFQIKTNAPAQPADTAPAPKRP